MTRIPSKQEILDWISENPTQSAKRDIARAFGIKGAARIDLKRLLHELEDEGHLAKRKKTYRDADKLPPVSVLEVAELSPDGELMARPLEWQGEGEAPRVLAKGTSGPPRGHSQDSSCRRLSDAAARRRDRVAPGCPSGHAMRPHDLQSGQLARFWVASRCLGGLLRVR